MTTHRLIPPAGGPTITVNGRTYSPASGAQDVPDFDSEVLQANNWSFLAISGPTSARTTSAVGSTPLLVGAQHWDTTLSHLVTWDGKNWRNEAGTIA